MGSSCLLVLLHYHGEAILSTKALNEFARIRSAARRHRRNPVGDSFRDSKTRRENVKIAGERHKRSSFALCLDGRCQLMAKGSPQSYGALCDVESSSMRLPELKEGWCRHASASSAARGGLDGDRHHCGRFAYDVAPRSASLRCCTLSSATGHHHAPYGNRMRLRERPHSFKTLAAARKTGRWGWSPLSIGLDLGIARG